MEPNLLPEIRQAEDFLHLVKAFYAKLLADPLMRPIFTESVQLDLDHHLPRIADFWATSLLEAQSYQGNPMRVHLDLDQKHTLKAAHFERWLAFWEETVDEMFQGTIAERAKQRARGIAMTMQSKLIQVRGNVGDSLS